MEEDFSIEFGDELFLGKEILDCVTPLRQIERGNTIDLIARIFNAGIRYGEKRIKTQIAMIDRDS